MIETNKENFSEVLKAQKAIIFFHKPGCSNCETMRPLLEKFEKEHINVKVYSYLCNGTDEVTDQFEIRVFPGIYHIANGVNVGGMYGVVPESLLWIPFLPEEEKMIRSYKLGKWIDKMKKEMDEMNMQKFLCEFSIDAVEKGEKIDIKKNKIGK